MSGIIYEIIQEMYSVNPFLLTSNFPYPSSRFPLDSVTIREYNTTVNIIMPTNYSLNINFDLTVPYTIYSAIGWSNPVIFDF